MAEKTPPGNPPNPAVTGEAGSTDYQGHVASEEQAVAIETQKEVKEPPQPTYNNPGPPPNGGLQAWLHVAGGFMLFFNTWGLLNTFAFFQTYYESGALFHESSSNISWTGSIQAFLVLLMGTLTGPIYDRGHLRALLCFGSFFIVFGLMMLSICKTYWEVLLAQGFCVGIGAGCLFVPCVSVLPTYWSTKLGLAVGLATSGSSLGGVIYPIVLYRLIDQIGFPWSVRVVGFIALGTLLVPITVMKMRVRPPKPRALIDWTAFRDIEYMTFVLATMMSFMGLAVVLFYLPYYVEERRMTSPGLVFYIVSIFNAGSCIGRVAPNALSDKIGPLNIITPSAIITGVLLLCMIPIKHEAAAIVMAILSGIFSGVLIALPPVCFVSLIKNKSLIGTRIGMGFGMIGLGLLAGGPGAGAILGDNAPFKWTGLWVFGGVLACAGGLMYAGLRVARLGFKLNVKG
ncbi:major facilitator superfamily domain-containing protein [Exophiala viscosa]|uniref:Major facilitator superfamily domain-containing protein n=1 Tax=Exophiala viscosa TaxID=2486360 RepID=A0AAN6IGQ5_9EURO|nr:major facilitator superfamily domain-containing protein [Exophiala viscosa]KAI1624367.1 major facilitator superfamily domain-containing protein [Exophiala viscosa]